MHVTDNYAGGTRAQRPTGGAYGPLDSHTEGRAALSPVKLADDESDGLGEGSARLEAMIQS